MIYSIDTKFRKPITDTNDAIMKYGLRYGVLIAVKIIIFRHVVEKRRLADSMNTWHLAELGNNRYRKVNKRNVELGIASLR